MWDFSRLSLVKTQLCLLCRQSSEVLICDFCTRDLLLFDCKSYDYNLLNWPKVRRGLKQLNAENVLALADYQWPLSRLLTGLKFSKKILHANALAKLFVTHALGDLHPRPQAIIPVPLHPKRYQTRKYNQSVELGKCISALTGIELISGMLTRHKATQTQTSLSSNQRKANVKNAFSLHSAIKYQHIAILDDVITTGATVEAIYQLIRRQYPEIRIDIWSICLTLEH